MTVKPDKFSHWLDAHNRYFYIICFAFFAIIAIVIYLPAFRVGFLSDDYYALKVFKDEGFIFLYHEKDQIFMPLMLLITSSLYQIFGMHPLGYHIFIVLIHCINALLISVLVLIIIKRFHPLFKLKYYLSFFCGLFFLVNPYHTEAVTWISGIAYPISLSLGLSAVIFFVLWVEKRKKWNLFLSCLFFLLAILSKEVALVIPGIIILIYVFDLGLRKKLLQKRSLISIAGFILLFLFLVSTYFFLRFLAIGSFIGHYGSDVHLAFGIKQTAFALLVYHAKFFMCYRFLPEFMHPVLKFVSNNATFFLSFAAIIIISLIFLRKRIKVLFDSKMLKLLLLFYLSFILALIPVINLELSFLGEIQSDRYGYFASAFYSIAAGFALFSILEFRKEWLAILALPIIWFSLNTYGENLKWEQSYLLSERIVENITKEGFKDKEIYIIGLPDTYNGVYTFRNCIKECLAFKGIALNCKVNILSYSKIKSDTAQMIISNQGNCVTVFACRDMFFVRSKQTYSDALITFSEINIHEEKICIKYYLPDYVKIYFVKPDGSLVRF